MLTEYQTQEIKATFCLATFVYDLTRLAGKCYNLRMRLKEKLLKVANFLRLIDENALLSITNIAVIVVVVKVAMATDLDFSDVAALLAVLGGYSFKRHANKDKVATPGDEFVKRLDDIENKVGAVGVAVGMKPPRRR